MNTSLQIKTLTREEILIHLDALAGILENCVNGGASVSFMLPFSHDKARPYFLARYCRKRRARRAAGACLRRCAGRGHWNGAADRRPAGKPAAPGGCGEAAGA